MARVEGIDTTESSVVETINGYECIEVYNILDVSGDPRMRKFEALNADGLPRGGEQHPFPLQPLFCASRSVQLIDTDKAKVTCKFQPGTIDNVPPDEGAGSTLQIRVGTTVQEVETSLDVNGDTIRVSYDYIDIDEQGNQTVRNESQTGTVKYQLPMTVVTLSRKETRDPLDKSRIFVGRMNSGSVFGDPAHWWLITKLEGESSNGGKSFNVTYEFQRKIGGWDPTVVFIDPDTGRPPEDILEQTLAGGDAIRTVQVLGEADFFALGIIV